MRLILLLILFMCASFLRSGSAVAACSSPVGAAGQYRWNSGTSEMQYCNDYAWTSVATVINTSDSCAGTTAGTTKYRNSEIQFCNGTNWVSTDSGYGTNVACTTAGRFTYNTSKTRMEWCNGTEWQVMGKIGFFIFTVTALNINALAGGAAHTECQNAVTSSDWLGKSKPWVGTVTAGRVRAFICYSAGCENLLPNKTYAFASLWNPSFGGALMNADSSGLGPNNNDNWHNPEHTGADLSGGLSKAIWTGRAAGSSQTTWPNTYSPTASCGNWVGVGTASIGATDQIGSGRWAGAASATCSSTNARMFCIVD